MDCIKIAYPFSFSSSLSPLYLLMLIVTWKYIDIFIR